MEYFNIQLPSLKEDLIESAYLTLLENKYSFAILSVQEKNYLLTKERSIVPINNLHLFLKEREKDCYFKTIIMQKKNIENIQEKGKLFHDYYHKYEASFHKLYGGKYRFGCIAIRINEHSFLTTIRGKKDFTEFTIVDHVDFKEHTLYVSGKKATLNAPLLAKIFENKKVEAIVHIHEFNECFPYYEYAFPGTLQDSIRENNISFNIRYHGVFLLFDKEGNRL